ncbi:MAG: prepilin-type N-terminal cleavage/methylation domain-containing protein [bacterium]|nr:prepilin-type N-terminal cleavage/methylation domain-containing protein [bacterium]
MFKIPNSKFQIPNSHRGGLPSTTFTKDNSLEYISSGSFINKLSANKVSKSGVKQRVGKPSTTFAHRKSGAGFTLIEIIVVMAIMAILATAGTTSFLGFRNKNRLKLAGDEVSSLLRLAHDRAVSQEEGSSWGVHFVNNSTDSSPYFVVYYGNVPSGPSPTGGTTSSIKYLDASLKFVSPSSSALPYTTTTLFNQLTGNLSNSSPVVIRIALRSDTNSSTTITVYNNGRVDY